MAELSAREHSAGTACCAPAELERCCEPKDKQDCCPPQTASCGCSERRPARGEPRDRGGG